MIIPRQNNHPSVFGGSGSIGVFKDITTTIHARTLAIPHTKYTVITRAGIHIKLLRTPDAGCGKILIQTRLKMNMTRLQSLFSFPGLLIHPT